MINCTCIVQAGQSPDRLKVEAQEVLNLFAFKSFGEKAQIAWIPVAEGNGFTAGNPSTCSVVSMTSNEVINPVRRELLLRDLVAAWTEATGVSVDEVVAVITDPIQA